MCAGRVNWFSFSRDGRSLAVAGGPLNSNAGVVLVLNCDVRDDETQNPIDPDDDARSS